MYADSKAERLPDRTIAQGYPIFDRFHVLSNISSLAAMRLIRIWISLLLIAGFAAPSGAQEWTNPEEVGMSAERLSRIGPLLQAYVDKGTVAGASAMVVRRGNVVYREDVGYQDKASGAPMTDSTLFRIYSMSKPITSVAVLMLYEEGRFQLGDPVSKFIPGFGDLTVYDADAPSRQAALNRPVTIHDLLTHQSGLTYGIFSNTPVDSLYRVTPVFGGGDLEDFADRVGSLPLLHQPGETWHYSIATDILGYVVEVASGMTLEDFFEQRIFEPLEMTDTGFSVEKEDVHRLSTNYRRNRQGELTAVDRGATSQFAAPVRFFSGGGGLVSTMSDYLRFAEMLRLGGTLDGIRLLGPKTVALMTADHLGYEYVPGWGFGLGVRVCTNVAATRMLGSEGVYEWSGAANTYFFIDPAEDLVAMVWTQLMPYAAVPVSDQFRTLVYAAIEE